jgi:hypothetical protein
MSASACLCRRSNHKNEYGVKMSIRTNAGIRMKDENRSKTGRSGAGLGKNQK